MGKFTKEMVDDYADKLLIGLTKEENKMVLDEFDKIDADIDKLNEIDGLSEVEPMTHCLDDFVYEPDSAQVFGRHDVLVVDFEFIATFDVGNAVSSAACL